MATIELYCGDITRFRTDAIVNAANRRLLGGGGVDGAIHRAAGPELLEACVSIPERNGVRCRTGEAVATAGFNLPARYIVHTVGPIYDDLNMDVCEELLDSCYLNSLGVARSLGCRSIAFPSISTGAYGFPIERAANRVAAIFSRFQEDDFFDAIAMVAYSPKDYAFYRDAFCDVIDPRLLNLYD